MGPCHFKSSDIVMVAEF